jgi:hypothetical protein
VSNYDFPSTLRFILCLIRPLKTSHDRRIFRYLFWSRGDTTFLVSESHPDSLRRLKEQIQSKPDKRPRADGENRVADHPRPPQNLHQVKLSFIIYTGDADSAHPRWLVVNCLRFMVCAHHLIVCLCDSPAVAITNTTMVVFTDHLVLRHAEGFNFYARK